VLRLATRKAALKVFGMPPDHLARGELTTISCSTSHSIGTCPSIAAEMACCCVNPVQICQVACCRHPCHQSLPPRRTPLYHHPMQNRRPATPQACGQLLHNPFVLRLALPDGPDSQQPSTEKQQGGRFRNFNVLDSIRIRMGEGAIR